MADLIITERSNITALADKIRSLMGETNKITLGDMAENLNEANIDKGEIIAALRDFGVDVDDNASLSEVANLVKEIESGVDTSDATATSSDILSGKTAYVNGKKIEGTINKKSAKTIVPNTTSQIAIPSGYYASGDIAVEGDSNLLAENIKSGVSIFGVSGTLQEGSGGGDTSIEDAFVTRTLSSTYTNNRVTTVGYGAFAGCDYLESVSFSSVTSIGDSAFQSCSALKYASIPSTINVGNNAFNGCSKLFRVEFPVATSIGNSAFQSCSALKYISFPAAINIGSSAFYECSYLDSVSFPAVTSVGYQAFYHCTALTSVSFPVATTIGGSAFAACNYLSSVSFPVATSVGYGAFARCAYFKSISLPAAITIGSSAFYYCMTLNSISFPVAKTIGSSAFCRCEALTSVNFPAVTDIGGNAFASCDKLTSAIFSVIKTINNSAFYNCSKLTTIYLLASSVCTLSNSNAFSKAGITSSTGSIFVRPSLVDSYKTATNWTYFSNRIFAYEE